ncbi:shikimate kinase [Chloroflexota bacterium]
MKTNVALIGFMGTGKSTIGRVLAEKLNKKFVELDVLIEQRVGKSIPEIFQQDGEITFRELEIEVIKEVFRDRNLVIACGGGIVLNKINVDRLRQESITVYLTASPKTILKRVLADEETRPLLNVPDKVSSIRELLRFRKPFYERSADIKIDTSKMNIDSVVEQIINMLKADESFNS